jgi:hypothetical protein
MGGKATLTAAECTSNCAQHDTVHHIPRPDTSDKWERIVHVQGLLRGALLVLHHALEFSPEFRHFHSSNTSQ